MRTGIIVFFSIFLGMFNQVVGAEHFHYSGTIDDELNEFAEKNYRTISSCLALELNEPIGVHLFEDTAAFHAEKGSVDSTDFYICTVDEGEIFLVNPRNPGKVHSEMSAKRAFAGAIAKVLLERRVQVGLPSWIYEGFSYYITSLIEEGKKMVDLFNWRLRILSSEYGVFPFIDELFTHSLTLSPEMGHLSLEAQKKNVESSALVFSFVRFFVEKWGYEAFVDFCIDGLSIEQMMMSQDRFASLWYQFEVERIRKSQEQ